MRLKFLLPPLCLFLLASCLPLAAQEPAAAEAYIAFGPGFANGKRGIFEFVDTVSSPTPTVVGVHGLESPRVDYNTAFFVRMGGVRYVGERWGVGGEYSFVRMPFDITTDAEAVIGGVPTRITMSLPGLGGTEHQFAAHLYYFFADRSSQVRPYVMGGPVLDWFFLRDKAETIIVDDLANGDPAFALAEEKDLSWGLNAGAGVRVFLSPHIGIFAEGRSLWSNTPQNIFPLGQATIRQVSTPSGPVTFTNDALQFNTPTRFLLQFGFGLTVRF